MQHRGVRSRPSTKVSRSLVLAAGCAVAVLDCGAGRACADTTWQNINSSWFAPGNWSGGVPGLIQPAILPASANATSPDIGAGTAVAKGLSLNNGSGAYSINGTGMLSLGSGSLAINGGGTSTINPNLNPTAPISFFAGASSSVVLNGSLTDGPTAVAISKDGDGTFQFNAAATSTTNQPLAINAGTVVVRNDFAFGTAPQIVVGAGTLQIGLTAGDGTVTLGDAATHTTLQNGAALVGGGDFTHQVGLFGAVAITNGASVTLSAPTGINTLALFGPVQNSAGAPSGTSSIIHVTGVGVVTLAAASSGASAFTGSWDFNQAAPGAEGLTFLTDPAALGAGTTPASVTMDYGYLTDVASTAAAPVPNPITLNGGVLNSTFTGGSRSNNQHAAFFSGAITVQSAAGSYVDMSDVTQKHLTTSTASNITLEGRIFGGGILFVGAPTQQATPIEGVLSLANISTATPNSQSGNWVIEWNAALAASSTVAGSNPFGAATLTLAGGSLRVNHPGSGNNGTINTFANTNITLLGHTNDFLASSPSSGGTLILGNASSANTGNTIVFNSLTFDSTGTSASQTLTV